MSSEGAFDSSVVLAIEFILFGIAVTSSGSLSSWILWNDYGQLRTELAIGIHSHIEE
jgi:hypothetical protein